MLGVSAHVQDTRLLRVGGCGVEACAQRGFIYPELLRRFPQVAGRPGQRVGHGRDVRKKRAGRRMCDSALLRTRNASIVASGQVLEFVSEGAAALYLELARVHPDGPPTVCGAEQPTQFPPDDDHVSEVAEPSPWVSSRRHGAD